MLFKGFAFIIFFNRRRFKLLTRTVLAGAIFILCISGLPFAPGGITVLNFNEGTGTTASDLSGNAHHGTLVNGPLWTTGKYGQGISLDGTNDYVNIADHNDYTLTPTQSYTWSSWVKNTNFNPWGTVWSQTIDNSNYFYFYAHTTTDEEAGPVTNGISVYWYNGSNRLVIHSNDNALAAGAWNYITITYNGSLAQASRFTIYVNGINVTNTTDVVSTGTIAVINPTNIRIGANQPFGDYLNGVVDEVRHYNRLLSASEILADMNTPIDNILPTVNISSPTNGSTLSATINVTANASDNIGVEGVQFLLDGANLGSEDIAAPYSVSWNTTTASGGNHILTARARDAAGNITTSSNVSVTVNNDAIPPTVTLTSPAAGIVSGTIDVTANASDNIGVVGVQFYINGSPLGAEDLTPPYSTLFGTQTVSDGNYVLTAKARDAGGNITTSQSVTVTVYNTPDNTPPAITLTNPPAFGIISGTVNVTANASDNIGVMGVQFFINGASFGPEDVTSPFSLLLGTSTISDGTYTLTATARDVGGNTTTTPATYVIVYNNSNVPDIIPPSINLTSPGGGVISGTINVTANATDNLGIMGVQFFINGSPLGPEDVYPPYAVSFGTTSVSDGTYILTARARDAFGNTTTTANTYVIVYNNTNIPDIIPPVITYVSPSGVIAGTVDVKANASDNIGILGVQFYFNGIQLGPEDVTPPYSASFGTYTLPDGTYILSATARDVGGNIVTTPGVQVIVYNMTVPDTLPPSVNITSPTAGIISGVVEVTAAASDNIGVVGVQFLFNGSEVADDTNPPYSFTFGTSSVSDGNYTLSARARDAAGNITTAANIFITVRNQPDTELPTITITAPAPGNVTGTISINADASDNYGVTGVQFLINGANFGAEDLTAPYTVSWSTTTLADGNYTLTAKARDAAGNIKTSSPVIVNVLNHPDLQFPFVEITSPSPGSDVTGLINIAATATDDIGVVGVQFLLNGSNYGAEDTTAPYAVSWNTLIIPNGTYTLSARARDASGKITTTDDVIVNVNNPPDIELPTIIITSPSAGNVFGSINVAATATDNIGIAGVQFLLDGINLGPEDFSFPYAINWNSLTASIGNHIVSARARDYAGNIAIADVAVTVVPGNPPVITAITVTAITNNSAIITWTTNEPANSTVIYDSTLAYRFSNLTDATLVSSHSQILYGLVPGASYHYQVISANVYGIADTSADNSFTTASLADSLGTLNTHTVLAYPAGKIIPWTPNPSDGYSTVVQLAWNYLLNGIPNDPLTGKPAYYSRSYINPNTQQMVNWDHNPAGLYAMLVESAIKYYGYSGNVNVMQLANDVALWHLDHGMTLPTDDWPGVPYSEGSYGSLNYNGANTADGVGNLEPDKIGELGYAWLQLYKYNGNVRFRDAAIQAANVLSNKIRVGTQTQSPWPFRVKASNGLVIEQYCSNIIPPISLFDDLIACGLGNTAAYQTARTSAWNWMMTFPMVNNVWAQYFEDVGIQSNYNNNLNQLNAMMVARYLLEHPEFDPTWQTHVRGLITWVKNTFGQQSLGSTIIREQQAFFFAMGSHTSRYASVNALLYEKTGDLAAKEEAYRAFNWATYMARPNGVVIDGPDVNNQWFSDGYGDYIRHFMTGMAAVPEWSPADQTHLLRSTSVIKTISYGISSAIYTTYDASSTDVLHLNFNPVTVTADGVALLQRSDLSQPGWILDVATKTIKVYHNGAHQITISSDPAPITTTVCPGNTIYFTLPTPGAGYLFQWQIDSTGNGFVNLVNDAVHSGSLTDTLWLNTPATSFSGYKYRCVATKNNSSVLGTPHTIKFMATWQGNSSNAWHDAANWSCNQVPDAFTDVVIPGSLIVNPVVSSNAVVRSITLSQGSALTISDGVKLDVKGK